MSKLRKDPKQPPRRPSRAPGPAQARNRRLWFSFAATTVTAIAVIVAIAAQRDRATGTPRVADISRTRPTTTNALAEMEAGHAVMVTVELDLGSHPPTIAEALAQVERRYQPDDGQGRTFAILDAYGEPTPQGKVHMSMHVSTEKPGIGALVFRRTGEVLWQSRIVAGTNSTRFAGKNLTILLSDEAGHTITVDGSNNPKSILEAAIKDQAAPVEAFWPDGAEREATFIYSACGCPVKVMAKREGDRTVRTKDLPVIFPDDPAVVALINRLMGW